MKRKAKSNINAHKIMREIELCIDSCEFNNALEIISNVKATKKIIENVDYYRSLAFIGINQIESAIEAAKEELRHYPENSNAATHLNNLLAQKKENMKKYTPNLTELEKIIYQIKAYTMVGNERLASLYTLAKSICINDIPGNFVECGVAAGGSSALLAWVIKKYSKRPRLLFCFDTFEGMPDPTSEDVHAGIPANDTGWGSGTCAAPMQSLIEICDKLGAFDIVRPVKGLFKDSLPQQVDVIGEIAFLHMDGDWYVSTHDILENLYQQVSPRGIIQVDDYGHWEGCKKALHEFETKQGVKFKLHRIDTTGVWFSKTTPSATANKSMLLNLGCGQRIHPDWVNVDSTQSCSDIISHDLTKGIPFGAESFETIYHSHLLEHFSKNYAPVFLNDCFRVLKPGGIIRIVVPDLENIVRLYLILLEKSVKGDEEARKRYDWIMLELFDQMVRNHSGGAMLEYWRQNPMPAEDFVIERLGSEVKDSIARIRANSDNNIQISPPDHTHDPHKIGQFRLSGEVHQWMYDRYSLGKLLKEAGFEDIKVCRADESRIPNYNSYLLDVETDGSIRKPDSLFMEARKPLTLSQKSDINTSLSKSENHSRSNIDISYRSNFSARNNNPNIVHLCTLDHGGAGVAALRLHLGLLAKGMNSDMLVLHTNSGKPRVHAVGTMTSHQSHAAWKVAHNRWQKVMAGHPHRPPGLELFTDTTSDALITDYHIFKQADIINLHWIPGLIDIQSMPEILSGKRVIWTLHDQNSFTGGCHYTGDCMKFQTFCHACPQLGSKNERDLAYRQWQVKKMAYGAIDLEIVTPSKWLAEQAKASALFAERQILVIPYGLPLGLFQPRPTQDLRKKIGLSNDDFILMFGAHAHTQRKGFAHLKHLLEVIPPRLQGKRVVAAAFGHLDAGLSKRIPLLELGFVGEPSRLAEFYSMADVYVLPAVEDNLPNTVMEAMACGTPVVGFEIGGMPDMVLHGNTGWLAKLGDVDGLVQGIMWARKFGEKARKRIATQARQYFNDGVQAKRYGRLYSEEPSSRDNEESSEILLPIPTCEPDHFEQFSYAKNSHFIAFSGLDITNGSPLDPQYEDLKRYQEALILTFIAANIPAGARILEVGGGNSRILAHLKNKYECWNVDKFEGLGNGPQVAKQSEYKTILDYMGNSNPDLPDAHFDFVFSVSALEHTPHEPNLYPRILHDINRVLKPGGWSLHLFDVVFKPEGFWTNSLLPYLFVNTSASYPMPDPEKMRKDPDLYVMSKDAYDKYWKKITGKSYEEFGRPTSINILWRKPSETVPTDPHKILLKLNDRNDSRTGPEILVHRTLPTISVVTPSFNQAEFLEECIDSILGQGYPNLEYVIMDGGSTDGSTEIIKRYDSHLKYWQSKKDNGQYWAINEGFKHTTGEIMSWLNSDDKYFDGSFFLVAEAFLSNPDIQWLMGRPTVWDSQGRIIHIASSMPKWSAKMYIDGAYGPPHIQQESTFWSRQLWKKAGSYVSTEFNYAGDMELWSRFFHHSEPFIFNALLGGFRKQINSKTSLSMNMYNEEAKQIINREKKSKKHLTKENQSDLLSLMRISKKTQFNNTFEHLSKTSKGLTIALENSKKISDKNAILGIQNQLFDAMLAACHVIPCSQKKYKVTAIVSTYKSEKFIEECLSDLASQTIAEQLEIIVVDAASPENERALVEKAQQIYSNITYIRTPRRISVYSAWNLAIRAAHGKYLTPFSTNDRLRNNAYEMMATVLDEKNDIYLTYGNSYLTDEPHQTFYNFTPSKKKHFIWPEIYSYQDLLSKAMIGPHPMWRKIAHDIIGYFNEKFTAWGDQDFFLRLGKNYDFFHINDFTGLYWWAENAISNPDHSDIPTLEKNIIRKKYKENTAYQASIIIPCFNNVKLTKNCLLNTLSTVDPHTTEIIIIDNGSTDHTKELAESIDSNIKIITNRTNQGFAKACNQGASAANGQYLVFLNNDTIPLSGWLTELIDFMKSHPGAGIAGSKLLYQDDTIQHCGAAMRFDGKFFRHPYKYLHRHHPLVNRVRELDAVTAACFITPRKLFFKLGKFDEHYLNGCEDMDYCTAVRRSGATIYYVPTSELYHLESQTPRPEDKDRENFQRYLEKWGKRAMQNEVEIYAKDGFWLQEGDKYSPSPDAITMLKDLGLTFNPSCPTPAETFQKIVKRIYPLEHWSKSD